MEGKAYLYPGLSKPGGGSVFTELSFLLILQDAEGFAIYYELSAISLWFVQCQGQTPDPFLGCDILRLESLDHNDRVRLYSDATRQHHM